MRIPSLVGFLVLFCMAAYISTLSSGCANIIPPSGGPRDSLPPQLLSATPKDSTLNFKSDRITFTFDEYIDDPQDLSNNVIFTPTFEQNPDIIVKARTMTLRFRDSLLPNTTYTLNFGNAIRDINEGNVYKNFVYTFSTGPALDSLTLSGKVILAENGRTDSTLIVMLHRNLADTAVKLQRPVYFTRVDASGNFQFRNLPKGTFAIYALGDATTNQRRYQNTTQQAFAFANEPVVTSDTSNITLYAYRAKAATTPATALPPRGATPGNDRRLRFSSNAASSNLDLQSDFTLTFLSPLRSFDSTKISLSTDSTFTPVTRYTAPLDSSRTVLRIRSAWREGTQHNLILDRDFAEDSAGRKLLKTDTLSFSTKSRSEYGQINIRIRNLNSIKNPVLLFVQNDQVVLAAPLKGGVYRSALFTPGEYDLRLLDDTNQNGTWDPGEFFGTKRQPEIVTPVPRKLVVKAGMENEFDIAL
jgi:hypothetical protein